MTVVTMKKSFAVPPSMRPEMVNRFFVRDQNGDEIHDPILTEIRATLAKMTETASAMIGARKVILDNVAEMPARRALQNAGKMRDMLQSIAPAIDKARANAAKVISNLETEMQVPKPDTRDPLRRLEELEIRQALKSMTEKQRTEALERNESFHVAVLNSPAELSGLHPARHKLMLENWRRKHHGPKVNHVERLTAADNVLRAAANRLVSFVSELSDSPELEAAGRAELAAKEALATNS